MDCYPQNLEQFLQANGYMPMHHIVSIARQLFASAAFLHDLGIVHTDLKPGNVLLCDATYFRNGHRLRELRNPAIRVADFSSSAKKDDTETVTTYHYRAPEILRKQRWSFECDMWGIGCMLVELFTRALLFDRGKYDLEHLAMMQKFTGCYEPPIEPWWQNYKSVKAMKRLEDIIPKQYEDFRDLLRQIFVLEPSQRITAEGALKHKWLEEAAARKQG